MDIIIFLFVNIIILSAVFITQLLVLYKITYGESHENIKTALKMVELQKAPIEHGMPRRKPIVMDEAKAFQLEKEELESRSPSF